MVSAAEAGTESNVFDMLNDLIQLNHAALGDERKHRDWIEKTIAAL